MGTDHRRGLAEARAHRSDGAAGKQLERDFTVREQSVLPRRQYVVRNAGERQQLTFKSERMTSRLLQTGSRLVMVLGVNKRPDREINYGTGDDVSEETIASGKTPIKIRWYSNSYIDIPIRR